MALTLFGTSNCQPKAEERFLETQVESLFDARLSGHESHHRTAGPRVYSGILTVQYEQFVFTPCHTNLQWWVQAADSTHLASRLTELSSSRYGSFLVTWTARLSEPGHFGHLGSYPHDIHVLHIGDIRIARSGDCELSGKGGA